MDITETLAKTLELLERQGWVSYQTLRRRFRLDHETLILLKKELLDTYELVREEGERLVWTGVLHPKVSLWQSDPSSSSAVDLPHRLDSPEPWMEQRPIDDVMALQSVQPLPPAAGQMVGRQQEQAWLRTAWTDVQNGRGQVILLRGEAGIGKSRLIQFVKAHLASSPHLLWECRGTLPTQHTAFYPIIELFQKLLRLQQGDAPAEKVQKIQHAVASWGLPQEPATSLLAALLAIPRKQDADMPLTTPARQRRQTMEILLHCLQAAASQQPVVLLIEDLHWIDASTLEWLGSVITQVAAWRVFAVLTCRPEFQAPWQETSCLTPLTLGRLLPHQTELLVMQVAGMCQLPGAIMRQLVDRTEGVPLFIEELTRAVLEARKWPQHRTEGLEGQGNLQIPTSLYESLMARLQRLGAALEVARVMSVWGRGATEVQLRMTTQLDPRRLDHALERLVAADILQAVHFFPRVTYVFKHALLQEAVYTSMPSTVRQPLHQRVAALLKKHAASMGDTPPELLAHHYTEGGMPDVAISYWLQAGQRAMERSAHHEAVAHLRRGLAVLADLHHTPERLQEALSLQTVLCLALRALKGYAAPEVEAAYAQARLLCQQVGDTPQLAQVLWGLAAFYLVRAELATACELGVELLTLGQRQNSPALLMEAYLALGMPLFQNGDVMTAQAYFEQATTLYRETEHQSHALLYGQDPGVVSLSYGSWALWLLGYPERALQHCRQAMALAERLAHPYSRIFALAFAARVYQCCRQWREAQQLLDVMMHLAHELGVTYYQAQGAVFRGCSLVMQGQSEAGMAQMQEGIQALRQTGTAIGMPSFLLQLAQGYQQSGQTEMALTVLDESLALAEIHDIHYQEAEYYRLKAEWIFALSHTFSSNVEHHLLHALEVARRQHLKSLELRVALSLSSLYQQYGKKRQAYALLSTIYSWFTEGKDTADLQEAAALLQELG